MNDNAPIRDDDVMVRDDDLVDDYDQQNPSEEDDGEDLMDNMEDDYEVKP